MRITARTFGHLASNPTLVFANTGLTGLALALASAGAEAQHSLAGRGASGVGAEAPAPGMTAAQPISAHVDDAQHALPCASSEKSPDAGPPAVERLAQSGNTITLWDEITPPAPAPSPTPLQQPMPMPVPVDAGRDAGTMSACALR
jgi:hypothetical protein